jgi:hypothetical protein
VSAAAYVAAVAPRPSFFQRPTHALTAPALGRLLLLVQVRRGKQVLEARAASKAANTAAGGWASSGLEAVEPAIDLGELEDLSSTLADIAAEHSRQRTAFLRALPAAANEVGVTLWGAFGGASGNNFGLQPQLASKRLADGRALLLHSGERRGALPARAPRLFRLLHSAVGWCTGGGRLGGCVCINFEC